MFISNYAELLSKLHPSQGSKNEPMIFQQQTNPHNLLLSAVHQSHTTRTATQYPTTAGEIIAKAAEILDLTPSASAPSVFAREQLFSFVSSTLLLKTTAGEKTSPEFSAPILTAFNTTALENQPIALEIQAASTNIFHNDTVVILIEGVPRGAKLSAGHNNGNGSWTLSLDQLENLTLTPAFNRQENFSLVVRAIAVGIYGKLASSSTDLHVSYTTAPPIPLTITPTYSAQDKDFSVIISGLPTEARLSAGVDQGDGVWLLLPEQLEGLTIIPPADYQGNIHLTVETLATNPMGHTEVNSHSITLSTTSSTETPALQVSNASGMKNQAVDLNIATSVATEAIENTTIVVSGLPKNASLSQGVNNGDGSWALTPLQLNGLQLIPPTDFCGTFNLLVTAVNRESIGSINSTTASMSVIFS